MVKITGDMLIGDVIAEHPKAATVMLKYGLHCVGCHVSKIENIKNGAKSHGMPDDLIEKMIADINDVLNKKIEELEVTDKAVEMIKQFAAEDGKEGQGLKIKVVEGCCGFGYEMEFTDKPADGDKTFDFSGVQLFIDKGSYKLLKGSEIDFVETPMDSGFKIENPNAPKGECACSGEDGEGKKEGDDCCGHH
ncbi:iron-sulfur cluster assembly accessory protein [Candidatus Woesearchaeota archaeon]|nr:iron-sulfur cluster assembly accessory protein [Candidatus Woesearchaeota archaeon]